MSELREVKRHIWAYRDQAIVADFWLLNKGEKFIVIEKHSSWWMILTQSGLRYVWFPDFEKSKVVE